MEALCHEIFHGQIVMFWFLLQVMDQFTLKEK